MRGLKQPSVAMLTASYAAPELFSKLHEVRVNCTEEEKKIDVYAFAIVTLEILLRRSAWSTVDVNASEIMDTVIRGGRPAIQENVVTRLADADCAFLVDLIKRSWDALPKARPTFQQLHESLKQRRLWDQ